MEAPKSEIIMYQSTDGITKIDVRMEGETLWLSQAQIAQLFGEVLCKSIMIGVYKSLQVVIFAFVALLLKRF